MRFWEFYRTICKRKVMIAGVVIATCAITLVTTANRPRIYQSTAQIMPSDAVLQRPILWSVATSPDGEPRVERGNRSGQLANLMSLVTSRTVAERTAQMLNLDIEPDSLKKRINVSTAPSPEPGDRQARTDIIRITARDSEPSNAVRVVNAVALVFTNYYQEISHQNAVANTEFLEEELAKAEAELDQAEARLRQYKQSKGVASLPEGIQSSVQNLAAIQQQRDEAAAQLAESQQRLASVRQQLAKESPTRVVEEGTTNSPMVQQLETQVAALRTRLIEAQAKYYDVHPTVQDLKNSLAEAQSKLDDERKKLRMYRNVVPNPIHHNLLAQRSQLESDARGFAARVAEIDASVARARGNLKPGEDVQLARLQQEFLDAQTHASGVKQKLHQARLDENDTSETGAIRLVDRALVAEGPIGRSRSSYLAMALILSLMVGIGLALTLETLDNRLRSNVDVEQLLSLPVNALIPTMSGRNAPALPKITYLDPLSPLAEAYRFLRTDLLLSAAESGAKTIMIATAKPGQGGTTTVANLAISLAMDGKRVVLVDADMRRPTLHRIFKAGNDYGLSSVLSEEKNLEDVLVSTEIENLLLLPAGQTPINPSELLGSRKMGELVAALASGADFVLFDTPSAIAFTDTVVLSRWIDGVLLVVRANQVPRGAELQVRKLFNKAKVQILGVVLNDVQPTSVDSYYYHSHYYPTTGPTRLTLPAGRKAMSDEQ
ncbi:MAG: polysaccharide biosynthesis tyrosine autokinase [Armatimonadetes bacterium]|nr:polysaccharide biosynthesis tyrosine autokinase [Armatimonadota bacterium]